MTIFSGFFGGPPILISPESAAGIKAGARTGLSTVVAGLFFCVAVFFAPLFEGIPTAGTKYILHDMVITILCLTVFDSLVILFVNFPQARNEIKLKILVVIYIKMRAKYPK